MARRRAFTLFEMLVVIAIIVVLLSIILPIMPRAREHARQVQCMSNMRQVTQALLQYTADSENYFLPLDSQTAQVGMAAGGDSSEVIPALDQYLQSPAVFHCPSDPRERKLSYPVNDFLGGTYPRYRRLAAKRLFDITNPATTFAFIEETDFFPKGGSFDPGGFIVATRASGVWVDAPAVLHNRGTCLSFVDGHCEYWVWSDPRMPTLAAKHLAITPNNPDLPRLQAAVGDR
jgi:prepilin-type N-terminal cleavage/methylation domain-containing protein